MRLQRINRVCAWAAFALVASVAWGQSSIDPALPVYPRVERLSGKITMVGSSTISQLAAIWGDSFKNLYPDVDVDVEVKGSVNAVAAVINGEANFGLLSRPITEAEVKAFHDKFGYLPTLLTPSLEPIAIYVHKDNPIESLSLEQIDAIFSKSLKRGAPKTAATWGDLGLTGKWATMPVTCQGRKDETGSQVFFQMAVLGGGEFRDGITQNATNIEMIKAIASDPRAVGFAGAHFAVPEVKAVPVTFRQGDVAFAVHDINYPLVRPLHIVVNKSPQAPLSDLDREFIKFIFSQRGQQDVVIGGFVPVPARPAQVALDAVGLSTLN